MPHASLTHLTAHGVGLTLPGGRVLFRDLHLTFGPERTGLVGANGVGKSVLLDILAGLRLPTTGRVVRSGRVGHVPQSPPRRLPSEDGPADPRVERDCTVAALLGVDVRLARVARALAGSASPSELDAIGDDWDLEERLHALLDRLGLGHLDPGRPVSSLSGGEATRVRLARPLLASPAILLLDEPTNDLDGDSRSALFSFLDEWGGGLVVASHDRTLLERMDRIVELSSLGVREYGGGWSFYREARRRVR